MPDFGIGPEIFTPGEGGGGAPEELSEEAKQRFAASAAAMKAIQREEKKSKKRDTRVARAIIQFLSDTRYTHLFVLISRLVARDCPSIFILAILSLIDKDCLTVVREYLKEEGRKSDVETIAEHVKLTSSPLLSAQANRALIEWMTRMQMVLSLESEPILLRLMVDEHNIDGTVLQLCTYVLQEFFRTPEGGGREIVFEKLHPLTTSILQTVFEPFVEDVQAHLLRKNSKDARELREPREEEE